MKDDNTGTEATMQDTPSTKQQLHMSDEEMRKYYPEVDKKDIAVVKGHAYCWQEDRQVWRFNLSAQAKLMAAYGPIEIPPADMDLAEVEDNTIRNLGVFSSTEALKEAHPHPRRGDGCFIGTSVAFWDAYWSLWQDYGPLIKRLTKDITDLGEIDLGTLFKFMGGNYTPAYVGPTDGVQILGTYFTESAMRAKHPTGEEDQGVMVAGGLFVWDVELKDWVFQGEVSGPGPTGGPGTPATAPGLEHAVGDQPIFKNDTIAPPPRPGSAADLEQRRRAEHERELLAGSKEHPSLNDVATLLESALGKLESEESDAAFKALDALKKVRKDLRHKRIRSILTWLLFFIVVGCGGYLLYKWLPTQVVAGGYTVPKNCSAPFGKGEITGQRFYDYRYKSLFGIHMTLESTVTERTVVNVGGQEFTVFGISPKLDVPEVEEIPVVDKVLKVAEVEVETAPKPPKGKWWRLNILPGDKGTMNMKPAEVYLFASEKDTAMVSYKTFCSANKDE